MKEPLLALSLLALACGCEQEPAANQIVPLEQVPASVMEAARKELPDYTFDTVYKMKIEGKDAYEGPGQGQAGQGPRGGGLGHGRGARAGIALRVMQDEGGYPAQSDDKKCLDGLRMARTSNRTAEASMSGYPLWTSIGMGGQNTPGVRSYPTKLDGVPSPC